MRSEPWMVEARPEEPAEWTFEGGLNGAKAFSRRRRVPTRYPSGHV